MASEYPGSLLLYDGSEAQADSNQNKREIFYIDSDQSLRYKDKNGVDHYYDNRTAIASGVNDHTWLTSIGTNSHPIIDEHLASGDIHFTMAGTDHTLLENIGTTTHPDIDVHIGSGALHATIINTLTDVDTTSDVPVKNEVLKWNGINWVPAAYNASFTFDISSFLGSPTTTPILISTGTWKAVGELSFTAAYANGPATDSYIDYTEWSNLTMDGVTFEGPTLNEEVVTYPSVGGYRQMTLRATDGETNDTRTETYYFYNLRLWGVDSNTTLDEAGIEGLPSNELSNSRAKTFTVTAEVGEYIWYCYPTRLGTATFTVGGFEGGFESPDTVSVTNSNGYTENYYAYRSTNSGLGSTTVGIT